MQAKSESIKQTLLRMLRLIVLALLALILPVNFALQIHNYHSRLQANSNAIFNQLEMLIDDNTRELELSKQEFTDRAIRAAEFIAYFTKHYPDKVPTLAHSRQLGKILDIDEINYFDKEGRIFSGTHPQYYGLSFNSGEQLKFFLPMLKDKSLRLCQDIVPNTAEGKPMQYAAVWLPDGSAIVQIGLEPRLLMQAIDSKSLENAVKHLPMGRSGHLVIVDKETEMIAASTNNDLRGMNVATIFEKYGFPPNKAHYHYEYFGKKFCVYAHEHGRYKIYRLYDHSFAIDDAVRSTLLVFLYVGLAALLVLGFISWYVNRKLIRNLTKIADDLTQIEVGRLDGIRINSGIKEFDEVTFYVNQLLQSVKSSWTKIDYIMKKGKMPLGIFEYNFFYKQSFYNKRLLAILSIDETLPKDQIVGHVRDCLQQSGMKLLDAKERIYAYTAQDKTVYLRIEKEFDNQSETYYVTDVSAWWSELDQLRDRSNSDDLTQLYNRRGFTEKMDELFAKPGVLGGASALIMLDADHLKKINDVNGHYCGDAYLKEISNIIRNSIGERAICGRLGGDEFAVFVYGYADKSDINAVIERLLSGRQKPFIWEKEDTGETVEFSMGCAYYPSQATDYHQLMRLADEAMYKEKRQRKRLRNQA